MPDQLSLTLPHWITFKLCRERMDHFNACIFRWTPRQAFLNLDTVLFRLTEQGSERVHVGSQASEADACKDALDTTGTDESVHELRTSSEIRFTISLPMLYQKHLKAGERYQLHWPGGEFKMWD